MISGQAIEFHRTNSYVGALGMLDARTLSAARQHIFAVGEDATRPAMAN
jgi:hypothetical protein